MFRLIIISSLSFMSLANANLNRDCPDLKTCIEKVSSMTGKKYYFDIDIKGKVHGTKNLNLTKENADKLLSSLLNSNGYTRIQRGKDVFQIINARDVRYTPISLVKANENHEVKLPGNQDYKMASFKLKYANASEVSRAFRPFMSRYGRIIEIKSTNNVIVLDTGSNIKRLGELIASLDQKPSKEYLRLEKLKDKHRKMIETLKAKNLRVEKIIEKQGK